MSMRVVSDYQGGVVELSDSPGAFATDEPTAASDLDRALADPLVHFSTSVGQYVHLPAETARAHIGVLEERLAITVRLVPELEQQVAAATAAVEADDARLAEAWAAVQQAVIEPWRRDRAQLGPLSMFSADPSTPLGDHTLGESPEWFRHSQLKSRRADPHSEDYGRRVRKTSLEGRLQAERDLRGRLESRLYELRRHLEWWREQAEKHDPMSARNVAKRKLLMQLQDRVRRGEIAGFVWPPA